MTTETLLLETVINESAQPIVKYVIESAGNDQALNHIACRPSEPYLLMVLKESGFNNVYMPKIWPVHSQFLRVKRVRNDGGPYANLTRTIMIASHKPLQNQFLAFIDKKLFGAMHLTHVPPICSILFHGGISQDCAGI